MRDALLRCAVPCVLLLLQDTGAYEHTGVDESCKRSMIPPVGAANSWQPANHGPCWQRAPAQTCWLRQLYKLESIRSAVPRGRQVFMAPVRHPNVEALAHGPQRGVLELGEAVYSRAHHTSADSITKNPAGKQNQIPFFVAVHSSATSSSVRRGKTPVTRELMVSRATATAD